MASVHYEAPAERNDAPPSLGAFLLDIVIDAQDQS